MDKDQFDGLIALKIVVEKQSFTAASEVLSVSPPAVSKMISQLEERMGVSLLIRTTRTVRLSEAGARFLNDAGPAINQIIEAQENAKNFGLKPSGILRLNMPAILFPYYLYDSVESFIAKFPEVTVEIFSDDAATDIFEKGFDAGVRTDDILAKDLIAFRLFGPIQFVAVASPEYLKKHGTPKSPKDLLKHNCIRHRFGAGTSIYENWEFVENKKEISVKIHGNLILNDSFSIRHAALNGFGVIYTELGNVKEDIETGKLKWLLKPFTIESSGYYLYYPHKTHISPSLRAFIDHFRESRSPQS